ncbi:hypothetical protein REPUB_Repub11eG0064100 [Reevesia pubescens]
MDFLAKKIFTHLDNYISRDKNVMILKRKLKELDAVKEDNESTKRVQLQPRKKLKKQVEIWFENVEKINGEILNDLETEVGLLSRGFLGANVLKRIQEVDELLQQVKNYDCLVIDDSQWIGQVLSTTTISGEVAKYLMKEIWDYLMADGVSKVGVWGMGGVGKTTIMKLINNQLLEETEKFNTVIWITVSKETNIVSLQNRIASAMNVSFRELDDETRRAGILYERLTQKGKYVLILDDVWDKFCLEEVGIPEASNGSKLVITTRSLDVCRYFECQEVRMPTLPEQDALNLFLEKVGGDVLGHEELKPIVESVAKQCSGLPLAIVTVASSMKGVRNIHEWRNALNELKRRAKSVNKLDEKVLQQLQFSYDRLEDETVKQCFLCCALYPEDSEIFTDKLIELWIAEGLVEELDSMQEEIDKGLTLLSKLINNCLLENGSIRDGESHVKLHDLVRDMALRITSVRPRFLVRAGMQLKEIPSVQEWAEDLDKVSLIKNWGMQIPPQMQPPKCQMLTILLLSECGIRSIPDCFFEQMCGLKILDLSRNPIKSLPNSISNLETLTALLLWNCPRLESVPSFSKLQALKKLNLEHTNIKELPHGMERLVNLKYLNLSGTAIREVPKGILSKFSCLQHFVGYNHFNMHILVRGDEIAGLRKLEIFKGRFFDLKELSSYVQALHGPTQVPREFCIHVGLPFHIFSYKKGVNLGGCGIYRNGAEFPSNIQHLTISYCFVEFSEEVPVFSLFFPIPQGNFTSLKYFDIRRCRNIKKLFSSDCVLQNLQILVELRVTECEEMEEIIASESESVEEGMGSSYTIKFDLPKLRILELLGLPKLKSICCANATVVCDSLEKLQIQRCEKLKRIPLYLPLFEDGRSSSLREIKIEPKESWENMEWDHPDAKSLLQRFLRL